MVGAVRCRFRLARRSGQGARAELLAWFAKEGKRVANTSAVARLHVLSHPSCLQRERSLASWNVFGFLGTRVLIAAQNWSGV
jgi:hypothetical protein